MTFQWTAEMIPWSELLTILEGQTVHLVAPESHFAQDIILSGDIPIFATSLEIVQFVGKRNHVQGGNAMMAARWKEKDLESCARCFSELIFPTAEI